MEPTNAKTAVEQGSEDTRTAEGAGESANTETVPPVAQESPSQAESVAAAQDPPADGCRFHASTDAGLDLTMTAKELGFPDVIVRHAPQRIGKLDYLDNALAIVTYEDGSTLSVQPCEIEIVPAKDSGQ